MIRDILNIGGYHQQVRAARLALAYISGDPVQSADLFVEISRDSRGEIVALQALAATLAEAYVGALTTKATPSELSLVLQSQIAEAVRQHETIH